MSPSLGPYLGSIANTLVYNFKFKSSSTYRLVVSIGNIVLTVREIASEGDLEGYDLSSVLLGTVVAL